MVTPLRYDVVFRVRLTSEQFDFLKENAARYDTDMSQAIHDHMGKLRKPERRRGRKEGTK